MKLENEIKQEKFRNEYHKLAVNIIYTYGWLMRNNTKIYESFGLTPQQYNILRILRGQYPNSANINLLKERMLDKMSDASRLVERLRVKGLLERTIAGHDRRFANVIITEKGLSLLKEIDKLDKEFDEKLSKLNEKEAQDLNSLLDKLRT
jgi:DNA-binding MarR family transcriptional regulator